MRTLPEIVREIQTNWYPLGFSAAPYVRAMSYCVDLKARYGTELASDIVERFLANANSWRGITAQRVKAELRAMLKEHAAKLRKANAPKYGTPANKIVRGRGGYK